MVYIICNQCKKSIPNRLIIAHRSVCLVPKKQPNENNNSTLSKAKQLQIIQSQYDMDPELTNHENFHSFLIMISRLLNGPQNNFRKK